MTVRGYDISNWDGPLAAATIARWQQDGIGHCVVRASLETAGKSALAQQQLQALVDAGLPRAVYVWCYPRADDPATLVQDTIALCDAYAPDTYWLDVEEVSGYAYPDAARNIAWLHHVVAACQSAGKRVGIYSGRWYWADHWMGNTAEFSDLPLWTSDYDENPDLAVWHRYGNWETAVGKQYHGGKAGQDLDRNVWDAAYLEGGPPMPEPAPNRVAELESLVGYVHGDLAQALRHAVDSARTAKTAKAREPAWQAVYAALDTLERETAP
jgi:hypothetical protein